MRLSVLLGLISCLWLACNNAAPKHQTKVDSDVDTSVKMDTGRSTGLLQVNMDDQSLAMDIFKMAMLDTRLSNIMQKKAYHPNVKLFANQVYRERRADEEALKSIALMQHIDLPTSLGLDMQNKVDSLSAKGGREIDYQYLNLIIHSHLDNLKREKQAMGKLKDRELKLYLTTNDPVLQAQLSTANQLLNSLNNR